MKINHKKLDVLLGKILEAHESGEVSKQAAISAIAHIVAAVEKGNGAEVESWLHDEQVYERWLKSIKGL